VSGKVIYIEIKLEKSLFPIIAVEIKNSKGKLTV